MKSDTVLRPRGCRYRYGRYPTALILVILAIPIPFLPSEATGPSNPSFTSATIASIKANLPPLEISVKREFPPQLASLFRYYGLASEAAAHRFGTFDSGTNRLAAHVYLPQAAVGSVFVLHGFFDHSGILQHLIRRCIEDDFAVAIFDLPGHGLSSGDPGAISDFAQYARIVADFVRICKPYLPSPYHLVGHSTGATIAMEVLLNGSSQNPDFDRIVLAAPLVHHRYHRLARAQLFLIKPFVNELPRRHHQNSSDPAFVEWSKLDPLQGRRMSLTWLEALYAWNDRMAGYEKLAKPVMVVQGTKDSVVDWRYNIAALQRKFSTVRLVWIEGGRHQLFNESPLIRAEVLQAVSLFLKEPVLPAGS